jgi:hypothetical protein
LAPQAVRAAAVTAATTTAAARRRRILDMKPPCSVAGASSGEFGIDRYE